jgi:WD40 repeat protein/serine/threonine protein kinase
VFNVEPKQPTHKITSTNENTLAGGNVAHSPPKILDHTLIRKIAEGSYGEIWLARNVMGTCRAVKILYRKHFDHERPYEREYEGIQKFEPLSRSHEGFVDILQIGRNDSEEYFYYVMELGDDRAYGQNFTPDTYQPKTLSSEVSTRGRLPVEECLHLALTITDALSQLHEHGLTHRDIKPSNIIFVNGTPKLADIGLVANIGHDRSYVGTEGFIAPEGPGSPQADIFSLGKVLYEISTGKDRHDFPELPDNFDTFPDAAAFREFNEVIIRACHSDLAQRYPSARKMYAELAVLINGDSIKRLRLLEHRLVAIKRFGLAALLLLVIGGMVAYPLYREYKMRQENRERQVGASISEATAAMRDGLMPSALASFSTALKLTEGLENGEVDNRQRCLSTLARCPKLVQMGFNTSAVSTVRFHPNGKYILATMGLKSVQFMDIASGQFLPPVLARNQYPVMADLSPDGKYVISAGANNSACIWEVATGERTQVLLHSNWVNWAQFSPDGTRIITGTRDNAAYVWDTHAHRLAELKGHTGDLRMACFSPDQRFIATASSDGTARVWINAPPYHQLHSFKHESWVLYASFSRNGKYLATSGFDRQAHVWNLSDGQEVFPAMNHGDGVTKVEFSPDERYLLTASIDGTARIWDAITHQPLAENSLLKNSDRTSDAAFNKEGNQIVIGCSDGTVRIWDFSGSAQPFSAGPICRSSDGAQSVLAQPLNVEINNARTRSIRNIPIEASLVTSSFQLSRNGRWLLAVSHTNSDHRLLVWDTYTNTLPKSILNPSPIGQVFLSSKTLAAFVYQKTNLQVFDIESAKTIGEPVAYRAEIMHVSFSQNDTQLYVAAGRNLFIVNPINGKTLFSTLVYPIDVKYFVFSDNQKQMLICLANEELLESYAQLFDVETHHTNGPPLRHRDGVLKAAFSPDNSKIATGSEDFTARIWEVKTGRPLTPPLPHSHQVRDVAFSPNGRWLLTVSLDRKARLWNAETGEPLAPPVTFPDDLSHGRFILDPYHIMVDALFRESSGGFWDLNYPRDTRPISDWQSIAYLLSGSSWTSQQANDQQAPEIRRLKLQETWLAMKTKYPEEFSTNEKDFARWHEQETLKAEKEENWPAAAFHLNYLRQHDPQSPFAINHLELVRQKLNVSEMPTHKLPQ